jgi:hypothetical protein
MHKTKSSIVRVCGAAAALFLLGCGSSSISGDPAAAFAGNWTFGSGSIDAMCTTIGNLSFPLTGDTMMVTRVDPTHVATNLQGNGLMCDVNFTVTGSTATATTGQTCTVMTTVSGVAVTALITVSSWTLTVSGDALTNAMSGTATAAGGLVSCMPVTADGAATRASDAGTGG